ncbi:MAG: hypothetical protein AAF074_11180 [Pseudomonadota bacterium]
MMYRSELTAMSCSGPGGGLAPAVDREQMTRLKAGWTRIAPLGSMAEALFCGRLLAVTASFRGLLDEDDDAPLSSNVPTIGIIITFCEAPEAMADRMRVIALGHLYTGVRAEDYAEIGEALVWTFRQLLGDAFSNEDEAAWRMAGMQFGSALIYASYGTFCQDAMDCARRRRSGDCPARISVHRAQPVEAERVAI